ncbi:hypothetical protein ASE66_29465 [Bosea sp. Root483D1]|uniref:hypothetical protein n=1 Tax=Bosea sp. Root483D1 TaxID=1736544 RepID=UPI000708E96C|nr:hypothetical protein [Bosea sp. Root483D1]KRE17591.1 hypothetical protein ASE66_29465 [Bosea sp. Root483D1]
MSNDDAVIARGLNVGLRHLLVAAIVHHAGKNCGGDQMGRMREALLAEIGRLAFKAESDNGGDADLTAAMRNALTMLLDAAYRDAEARLARNSEILQ